MRLRRWVRACRNEREKTAIVTIRMAVEQTWSAKIPLNKKLSRAASVRATLYYQSIPPYFLFDRATDAVGPDTERLIRFTREIKLNDTPVRNWRLPIAAAQRSLGAMLLEASTQRHPNVVQ